jgi:hypothetical protein
MAPEERSLESWHQAGSIMIRQDVEEASQWIGTLEPGPGRDAATDGPRRAFDQPAAGHVSPIRLQSPCPVPRDKEDGAAAFSWAASMSGEPERHR